MNSAVRGLSTVMMLLCILFVSNTAAQTEMTAAVPANQNDNAGIVNKLHALVFEIEQLSSERDAMAKSLEAIADTEMLEQREQLAQMKRTLATLRSTFEVTALAGVDTGSLDEPDEEYNWRTELIEIASPLLESLKNVTEKPRRKAELMAERERLTQRLVLAVEAARVIEQRRSISDKAGTTQRLELLSAKWSSEIGEMEQQRDLVSQQLESINKNKSDFLTAFGDTSRAFFLGRGLTIFLAIIGALVAWGLAKFIWWFANRYLINKRIRRRSFWYRLFSYSYFLVTFIFIVVAIFLVLYLRDDILLIALMFLLLAAATLSLRSLIPQYMKEARLLLNLGAVREEEVVVYDGLPWVVRSLNLYSTLHNPKLTGIVRLPMDKVKNLVSRPIKETIWFPTSKNDYIFLPDGSFGKVLKQTPDLVEVEVRGGMVMTFRARDFYAQKITNLSRNATFGVSSAFTLSTTQPSFNADTVSLDLISAIRLSLAEAGYGDGVQDVIVDTQASGETSMACIVYLTVTSKYASNYFSLQRLVQKASIDVCNNNHWAIPDQKLAVHSGMA